MTIGEMKITDDEFDFGHMFLIDLPLQLFHSSISVQECIVLQVQHKRYSAKGDAGTYPSCQRWFLPVLPTTLARLLLRSQAEREALRSFPTGQARRNEKRPHPASTPLPPKRDLKYQPCALDYNRI